MENREAFANGVTSTRFDQKAQIWGAPLFLGRPNDSALADFGLRIEMQTSVVHSAFHDPKYAMFMPLREHRSNDLFLVAEPDAADMIVGMSTLAEIESAARQLAPAERQQLLIFIAQMLREEGPSLPEPRSFSTAEIQGWMDEDENDLKEFNGRS